MKEPERLWSPALSLSDKRGGIRRFLRTGVHAQ